MTDQEKLGRRVLNAPQRTVAERREAWRLVHEYTVRYGEKELKKLLDSRRTE